MKTYTRTVGETRPLLVIEYDTDADSPREWDNLGYFITVDRNYRSPDDYNGTIYNIVKSTGDVAESRDEHMKLIKKAIKEDTGEKVVAIYPVVKYEHSAVYYSLGSRSGFDCSNNGFYIVTNKTQKTFGTPKSRFEKVIKEELAEYTKWVNGEVYRFTLFNKDGEHEDSCGGFYSLEDIREYLPKEWKNEKLQDYLNY